MKRIIVTGGAGWIGRAVCEFIRNRGFNVSDSAQVMQTVVLDRDGCDSAGFDFVPIDLSTDEGLGAAKGSELCQEADALIHCAGYAHRPVETPEEVERFFAINRDGTARVVRLCEECGIPRIVYLSSIAFYDWGLLEGKPADEDSPLDGKTAYAQSKLEGEQIVRESGLDGRVARLATVVGQGDRANFSKLAGALNKKRFLLPGKGEARKSVLSVNTAARLLVDLAMIDDPRHRLLNLAEGPSPTLGEICDAFREECGFPATRSLPLPIYQFMALAGDIVAKIRPNFPLTTTNLRKLTTSTAVSTDRMKEVFPGFKERTFREILEEAKRWYEEG